MAKERTARPHVSHHQLLELVPDLEDDRAAAILGLNATTEEIEEAVGWASGQSGVMGELRHPLSGRAARVYDILVADRGPTGPKRE